MEIASLIDESWPLRLMNVLDSKYSGKGVKVAVLDSGLNLDHPDFRKDHIVVKNFIPSESSAKDLFGHGTHCAGLIAGCQNPGNSARYGIAPDCNLYVGKIVNQKGVANSQNLIEGVNWALENDCKVILISLGLRSDMKSVYSKVFNELAQKALSQNTIIVAPVGNHSDRSLARKSPISHPGNCPNVFSVTAIDCDAQIYNHANTDVFKESDEIQICAPGVDVNSSWHEQPAYLHKSGTSVAAALAAGVLALWFEAYPSHDAKDIIKKAKQNAKKVDTQKDIGAGIIQAPIV
ncbi:MAG: S8 family serine peptidase [Cyclobacteriaceae bacterium]